MTLKHVLPSSFMKLINFLKNILLIIATYSVSHFFIFKEFENMSIRSSSYEVEKIVYSIAITILVIFIYGKISKKYFS